MNDIAAAVDVKQTEKPVRWQIESGTRGVYVGSTYAERTTNWPLFSCPGRTGASCRVRFRGTFR
jgi:hypothetical protein